MDNFTLGSSWIFNFIPWWVWVIAIVAAVGALLFFFGPILLPIWGAMPTWMKAILIGITGGFVVYAVGRNKGSKDERDMQRRRDAQATQHRQTINRDVQNLSKPAADERLDPWYRKDD